MAAKIIDMVDNTHGPGLKVCFDNEHQSDGWSAIVVVRFQRKGAPTLSTAVLHEGSPDSSPTAKNITARLGNIADWPWPQPQGFDELDGGNPYIRISVGYTWQAL
jgi:hypothetical protein